MEKIQLEYFKLLKDLPGIKRGARFQKGFILKGKLENSDLLYEVAIETMDNVLLSGLDIKKITDFDKWFIKLNFL